MLESDAIIRYLFDTYGPGADQVRRPGEQRQTAAGGARRSNALGRRGAPWATRRGRVRSRPRPPPTPLLPPPPQIPLGLRLGPLTALSCGLAMLPRMLRGSRYRPAKMPQRPLVLWVSAPGSGWVAAAGRGGTSRALLALAWAASTSSTRVINTSLLRAPMLPCSGLRSEPIRQG